MSFNNVSYFHSSENLQSENYCMIFDHWYFELLVEVNACSKDKKTFNLPTSLFPQYYENNNQYYHKQNNNGNCNLHSFWNKGK